MLQKRPCFHFVCDSVPLITTASGMPAQNGATVTLDKRSGMGSLSSLNEMKPGQAWVEKTGVYAGGGDGESKQSPPRRPLVSLGWSLSLLKTIVRSFILSDNVC